MVVYDVPTSTATLIFFISLANELISYSSCHLGMLSLLSEQLETAIQNALVEIRNLQ